MLLSCYNSSVSRITTVSTIEMHPRRHLSSPTLPSTLPVSRCMEASDHSHWSTSEKGSTEDSSLPGKSLILNPRWNAKTSCLDCSTVVHFATCRKGHRVVAQACPVEGTRCQPPHSCDAWCLWGNIQREPAMVSARESIPRVSQRPTGCAFPRPGKLLPMLNPPRSAVGDKAQSIPTIISSRK